MKKILLLNVMIITFLMGWMNVNAQSQVIQTRGKINNSTFRQYPYWSDLIINYYFVDSTQYGFQNIKEIIISNWETGDFSLGVQPIINDQLNINMDSYGWLKIPYPNLPFSNSPTPYKPGKYYLVIYTSTVLGNYKAYSINQYSSYFYDNISNFYFFTYNEIPNTFYSTPYTVTGLEEKTSQLDVKTNGTSILINSEGKTGVVEVYDMQGLKVASQDVSGTETNIQLPSATGMYVVKLLSDNQVYTQKIVFN